MSGSRPRAPWRPTSTSLLRPVLAVGALAAAALGLVTPAAASCAGPTTPAELLAQDGDVVLAAAQEVDGHRVLLDVEEVWSGQDRAPEIRVVTGETLPGSGSSSDGDLARGERYLLSLRGDRTGACGVVAVDGPADGVVASATTAEVDAARPADVRAPVEGADAGDAPGPPVAAVAAGLALWAALTAVVLLAGRSVRRRQERRARSRRSVTRGPERSSDGGSRGLR